MTTAPESAAPTGIWRRLLQSFGRKEPPAPPVRLDGPKLLFDGVAEMAPAPAGGEAVRLVIWDMDETFWRGTLEEGGITLIERNLDIVRTLSRRGIVNSIASKNHAGRVQEVLEAAGIWDLFVLPQIAFQSKGELVRAVIENCQLRPESVLFIDDNTINLNEVAHYNPGIQVALPDVLAALLADPRCKGGDDPELARLAQYKILERRVVDRVQLESDNTAFLRQSDIRVSIHHDVMEQFDRVYDLANRTNQLNFTKLRLSADIEIARGEMQGALAEYNCHAAYIKVADRYGYHGICGFYMLRSDRLQHLLFSCRILNMGIEQLIYQKIGRPGLAVVGEVVADPAAALVVDWVTIVADAEVGSVDHEADAAGTLQSICLRGGCELSQTAHYLRERHVVHEEFPYGRHGWGIQAPLSDYMPLRDVYRKPEYASVFDGPWFDPAVMKSRLYDRSAEVYVLAFGTEPYVFRYRHLASGLVLPLWLDGFEMADLTTVSYADAVAARGDPGISEAGWTAMQAAFERVFRFDAERLERDVTAMFDLIADKRVIVILSNTRFGKWHEINEMGERVNEVIRRVATGRPIAIIGFDDIIRDDAEVLDMNHFRREVYMRLAEEIGAALSQPLPGPLAAVLAERVVRRNMLPFPEKMVGHGWQQIGDAEAAVADHPARFAGSAVVRHTLRTATAPADRGLVFGHPLSGGLLPGQVYALSAWVWIPAAFGGANVGLCGIGYPSPHITRVSLHMRDAWQRIWVTVRVPLSASSIYPALRLVGGAGDFVFSTAWKLEHADEPSEYVAGDGHG